MSASNIFALMPSCPTFTPTESLPTPPTSASASSDPPRSGAGQLSPDTPPSEHLNNISSESVETRASLRNALTALDEAMEEQIKVSVPKGQSEQLETFARTMMENMRQIIREEVQAVRKEMETTLIKELDERRGQVQASEQEEREKEFTKLKCEILDGFRGVVETAVREVLDNHSAAQARQPPTQSPDQPCTERSNEPTKTGYAEHFDNFESSADADLEELRSDDGEDEAQVEEVEQAVHTRVSEAPKAAAIPSIAEAPTAQHAHSDDSISQWTEIEMPQAEAEPMVEVDADVPMTVEDPVIKPRDALPLNRQEASPIISPASAKIVTQTPPTSCGMKRPREPASSATPSVEAQNLDQASLIASASHSYSQSGTQSQSQPLPQPLSQPQSQSRRRSTSRQKSPSKTPSGSAKKKTSAKKGTLLDRMRISARCLPRSDGERRGQGLWPTKGPNTKKGRLQEIICDTCRGRCHWSCAGLLKDDEAALGNWNCPDCEHALKTMRPGEIAQAPIDRCIRHNCILRENRKYDEDEGDDEQYVVEKVIGRRATARNPDKTRIFDYLIKWAGYDISESTWEPQANIDGEILIGQFRIDAGEEGGPEILRKKVTLLNEAKKFFDIENDGEKKESV